MRTSAKARRRLVLIAAAAALAVLGTPSLVKADAGATLSVRVTGLSNGNGSVLCSLFRSADGFPGDHRKAYKKAEVTIKGGQATLEFKGLPPGDYAVAAFHDENGNDELDKGLLGAPTEGWGVSRNPGAKLRAPRWNEASFDVPQGATKKLNIKLNY